MARRVRVMSAARRRCSRAVVVMASTLLVACESLVGIHDSRGLPEGLGMDAEDGSSLGAAGVGGIGAVDPGGPAAIDGASGRSGSSVEQSSPIPLEPGGGSSEPAPGSTASGDELPAIAPEPGTDGVGETSADAGAPVTTEPDPPPPDPIDDTPAPVDEPICPPEPASPELSGTAFLFTAGPNDGNANGRGICGFRNALLPRAPRYYGAIEPALMEGKAALCGACMRLRLGNASVDVTVVDVIEPNPLAHGQTVSIDADAKRELSSSGDNLDVQFSFVPCDADDTIRLQFAAAGDPSVLVLGHRNALRSVRLSAGGRSVELVRRSYNFWEPPAGFSINGAPVSLTLTDVNGTELTLDDLTVNVGLIETGQQFAAPACTVAQP